MLSEEKKAVEIVKKIKNMKFNVTSSFYSSGTISLNIEEKESIDTVLNLITKLQKENEEKDKQIDLMALAIINYDDQLVINRYKDINEVKETFKDLAKEKGE